MRVEKDGVYAAVASKGGAPTHPTWYYNFLAHPVVELQDGPEPHTYRARIAEGEERAEWWERAVAQYSRRTRSTRRRPTGRSRSSCSSASTDRRAVSDLGDSLGEPVETPHDVPVTTGTEGVGTGRRPLSTSRPARRRRAGSPADAGQHRPLVGLLRADPGAARPAGRGDRPGHKKESSRSCSGSARAIVDDLQPASSARSPTGRRCAAAAGCRGCSAARSAERCRCCCSRSHHNVVVMVLGWCGVQPRSTRCRRGHRHRARPGAGRAARPGRRLPRDRADPRRRRRRRHRVGDRQHRRRLRRHRRRARAAGGAVLPRLPRPRRCRPATGRRPSTGRVPARRSGSPRATTPTSPGPGSPGSWSTSATRSARSTSSTTCRTCLGFSEDEAADRVLVLTAPVRRHDCRDHRGLRHLERPASAGGRSS